MAKRKVLKKKEPPKILCINCKYCKFLDKRSIKGEIIMGSCQFEKHQFLVHNHGCDNGIAITHKRDLFLKLEDIL